jgi:hypothetical protein
MIDVADPFRRRSMQMTVRRLLVAALAASLCGVAIAKLPPPAPKTPDEIAADAAKKKAAAEKTAAEITAAEDRAVANYVANEKAKGVAVHTEMPAAAGVKAKAEPKKK